jgi:hypothetical protein
VQGITDVYGRRRLDPHEPYRGQEDPGVWLGETDSGRRHHMIDKRPQAEPIKDVFETCVPVAHDSEAQTRFSKPTQHISRSADLSELQAVEHCGFESAVPIRT